MRAEKKQARARNKLAELFGMEAPEQQNVPSAQRISEDISREGEAVIAYLSDPKKFKEIACRHCGKPFKVNRANVALCSDYCREKELAAVGITWRWNRSPEQRWYYAYDGDPRNTEPLVIGPEATTMLNSMPEDVVLAALPEVDSVNVNLSESESFNDAGSVDPSLSDDFIYGFSGDS